MDLRCAVDNCTGKRCLFCLTSLHRMKHAGWRCRYVTDKAFGWVICQVRHLLFIKFNVCLNQPRPYWQPHQVSKASSLYTIEKCKRGKSATQIFNFGKGIGSDMWAYGLIDWVIINAESVCWFVLPADVSIGPGQLQVYPAGFPGVMGMWFRTGADDGIRLFN